MAKHCKMGTAAPVLIRMDTDLFHFFLSCQLGIEDAGAEDCRRGSKVEKEE